MDRISCVFQNLQFLCLICANLMYLISQHGGISLSRLSAGKKICGVKILSAED